MISTMTDFISWLFVDCLPEFIQSTPITCLVALACLGYVVSLIIKLLHY